MDNSPSTSSSRLPLGRFRALSVPASSSSTTSMVRRLSTGTATGLVLTAAIVVGGPISSAHAEPSHYRFDFGAGPVEPGYVGVSAHSGYDAETGYGFNTPDSMADVPASGAGAGSDAVQFLTYGMKSTNTFDVDLPRGLYRVTVTLGDTARSSVAAEGVFQLIDLTGNEATDSFEVPVTDGQLNLLATAGKVGKAFTLSSLEIKKVSNDPTTHPTIWVGGDSTVCNYYPLGTSAQAGWGQQLPEFIHPVGPGKGHAWGRNDGEPAFDVRDLASGGQIARGFRDDGQFESILKYIKPGDYFLLEMGINDTNPKNNTTEEQFTEIMRDMVEQVKATGATVVLVTPQGRATDFVDGVHSSVDRWYRHATIALAHDENVALVDLNVLSSAYFTSIGQQATSELYMPDQLHPNRAGATELAHLVVQEMERQQLDGFVVPKPSGM